MTHNADNPYTYSYFRPAAMPVSDAMRYIGVKRTKMFALIANRSVRAARIGRRTVVFTDSLDDLLARSTKEEAE